MIAHLIAGMLCTAVGARYWLEHKRFEVKLSVYRPTVTS